MTSRSLMAAGVLLGVIAAGVFFKFRSNPAPLRAAVAPPVNAGSDMDELRREVTRLRSEIERLRTESAPSPFTPAQQPADAQETLAPARARFQTFSETGHYIGGLRQRMVSGARLSAEEIQWLEEAAKSLAELEKWPAEFTEFQSSFIASLLGLDSDRQTQIKTALMEGLRNVSAAGLALADIARLPEAERQHAYARRQAESQKATDKIHEVLSEEERNAFDSAFMTILDIDLGVPGENSPSTRYHAPVLVLDRAAE